MTDSVKPRVRVARDGILGVYTETSARAAQQPKVERVTGSVQGEGGVDLVTKLEPRREPKPTTQNEPALEGDNQPPNRERAHLGGNLLSGAMSTAATSGVGTASPRHDI
jgi:hypothetical protein